MHEPTSWLASIYPTLSIHVSTSLPRQPTPKSAFSPLPGVNSKAPGDSEGDRAVQLQIRSKCARRHFVPVNDLNVGSIHLRYVPAGPRFVPYCLPPDESFGGQRARWFLVRGTPQVLVLSAARPHCWPFAL